MTADIDGFALVPEAILPELERRVLEFAVEPTRAWEHPVLRKGLLPARRGMISYGSRYVTSARSLGSADPLPSVLEECRVRAADLVGVESANFTQAILTHYPPKAGIGWHADAPVFGEPVVTLSLGCDWWMDLRCGSGGPALRIALPARSLLVLRGDARWSWQHRIPELKTSRYSVSFRTLA